MYLNTIYLATCNYVIFQHLDWLQFRRFDPNTGVAFQEEMLDILHDWYLFLLRIIEFMLSTCWVLGHQISLWMLNMDPNCGPTLWLVCFYTFILLCTCNCEHQLQREHMFKVRFNLCTCLCKSTRDQLKISIWKCNVLDFQLYVILCTETASHAKWESLTNCWMSFLVQTLLRSLPVRAQCYLVIQ